MTWWPGRRRRPWRGLSACCTSACPSCCGLVQEKNHINTYLNSTFCPERGFYNYPKQMSICILCYMNTEQDTLKSALLDRLKYIIQYCKDRNGRDVREAVRYRADPPSKIMLNLFLSLGSWLHFFFVLTYPRLPSLSLPKGQESNLQLMCCRTRTWFGSPGICSKL